VILDFANLQSKDVEEEITKKTAAHVEIKKRFYVFFRFVNLC